MSIFRDEEEEELLKKGNRIEGIEVLMLHRMLQVLERTERVLRRSEETLERIDKKTNHYSIQITLLRSSIMAIGNIVAGGSGQLGTALLENGSPFTPPDGSTYVFSPSLTADDPSVTFAPATTDASGGTVPLEDQVVISVPAGDTNTSVTVTATATDPNGGTAQGTLTIALTPTPQVFTIAVTQLA